jgi:hypothetical protein
MRYIRLNEKKGEDATTKFLNETSVTLIEPKQNNTVINFGNDKQITVLESISQVMLMLEQDKEEVVLTVMPRIKQPSSLRHLSGV